MKYFIIKFIYKWLGWKKFHIYTCDSFYDGMKLDEGVVKYINHRRNRMFLKPYGQD